jgi:hypothetical protein
VKKLIYNYLLWIKENFKNLFFTLSVFCCIILGSYAVFIKQVPNIECFIPLAKLNKCNTYVYEMMEENTIYSEMIYECREKVEYYQTLLNHNLETVDECTRLLDEALSAAKECSCVYKKGE